MAHTISKKIKIELGNKKAVKAEVAISAYTTDGEAITAGELGLRAIESLDILSPANGTAIFGATADAKITAYTAATVQAAGNANVGSVRIMAVGY